jgi:hypothetical protein
MGGPDVPSADSRPRDCSIPSPFGFSGLPWGRFWILRVTAGVNHVKLNFNGWECQCSIWSDRIFCTSPGTGLAALRATLSP